MRSVAMMVVPLLPSAAAEQQKKMTERRKKTGYGGSQKQRISIHPHPIPASSRKRCCSHQ